MNIYFKDFNGLKQQFNKQYVFNTFAAAWSLAIAGTSTAATGVYATHSLFTTPV